MTYDENAQYNVLLRTLGIATEDPCMVELIYATTLEFSKKKGFMTIADFARIKHEIRGKHQKHLENKE